MKVNDFDLPPYRSGDLKNKLERFSTVFEENAKELSKFLDVDIFKTDRFIENVDEIDDRVVCTTYFTAKVDPQRNIKIDTDNIKYIQAWYSSIMELNLFGIVFHDNLSSEFVKKYQTSNIKFVKCKLGPYSLNDERFIIYYMFFLKHRPKYILFTDGNDVVINKNPFLFLIQKPASTIFVGRGHKNKIYQSDWNLASIERLSKNLGESVPNSFFEMAVYNAGIIGGSYFTIMLFLRQICRLFFKINKDDNNNMAAMHYVLYYYFYPNCRRNFRSYIYHFSGRLKVKMRRIAMKVKLGFIFNKNIPYHNDKIAVSEYIFSGFPLNSKLKKFETDSSAYITHK